MNFSPQKIIFSLALGISATAAAANLFSSTPLVSAQISTSVNEKNNVCPITDRFRRWDDFLTHGLSYSDWVSNWKDIFTRNSCQRDDILILQAQMQTVHKQIRSGIFNCNFDGLDDLIQLENRIQTEIEYVRGVVDSDTEKTTGNPDDTIAQNRTRLYRGMHQELVVNRRLYSKATFDSLFLSIESKYKNRVTQYLKCEDPTVDELVQNWNAFVDGAAGIKPAWNSLSTTTEQKWNRLIQSPSPRSGNSLAGFLNVQINGLPPEQSLNDIIREFQQQSPGGSADILDVLNKNDTEKNRFQFLETRAQRFARYEAIYRYGADSALDGLIEEAANINETLDDSMPALGNLRECVAAVSSKQCGG